MEFLLGFIAHSYFMGQTFQVWRSQIISEEENVEDKFYHLQFYFIWIFEKLACNSNYARNSSLRVF